MVTDARKAVLIRLLDLLEARLPARPALVALDGFDGVGKTHMAHELRQLSHHPPGRRPILNVSIDGFHQPRHIRYRHGQGPESFYRDSYDYQGFLGAVVEPLHNREPITPALWDVDQDHPVTPVPVPVPDDGIVLVDGMFLHRPELVDLWDASIWLRVPFHVSVPRGNMRFAGDHDPDPEASSNHRYVGGQRLYLAEADPETHCTWIIDNTNLNSPTLHPADDL